MTSASAHRHPLHETPTTFLAELFRAWHSLLYVLKLCRFSVLVILAGALLLWTSQGRDMLIAFAESPSWLDTVSFLTFMLFWASLAWYFARVMNYFKFPATPPGSLTIDPKQENDPWWSLHFMRMHVPRVLLLLAFGAVLVNLWGARSGAGEGVSDRLFDLFWYTLSLGMVAYLLVLKRRWWVPWVRARFQPKNRVAKILPEVLFPEPVAVPKTAEEWEKAPVKWKEAPKGTIWITRILIFITIALFFFSTIRPLWVDWAFDPLILFFVWAGALTATGGRLVYWQNRKGFPLLLVLLVLALVFSFVNDNHQLRIADSPRPITERPTLAAAAKKWVERHAKAPESERPVPLVIVATAGGGIRAAYWTALVLGELDTIPGFSENLFAISGVSGGSVGATLYRALIGDEAAGVRRLGCQIDGRPVESVKECALEILSRDLLTPAVADALYPDLLQRFSPFGDGCSIFGFDCSFLALPDRQRALELGFSSAFEQVTGDARLEESLLSLYASQKPDGTESWPALLLNATWVTTGHRIVASNLDLRSPPTGPQAEPSALVGIYDQLSCIGRDLPLITAAANSARFPGLSPAGTLRVPADGKRCWQEAAGSDTWRYLGPGDIFGRLVDGGYFENFGAVTARQVLDEVLGAARKAGLAVQPIVIQISSDPELPSDFASIRQPNPIAFAYEIRSPITAAFSTRSAHGVLAAKELEHYAKEYGQSSSSDAALHGETEKRVGDTADAEKGASDQQMQKCGNARGEFLHFRMLTNDELMEPPLGWALSELSRFRIESYLDAEEMLQKLEQDKKSTSKLANRLRLLPRDAAEHPREFLQETIDDSQYQANRRHLETVQRIFACRLAPAADPAGSGRAKPSPLHAL